MIVVVQQVRLQKGWEKPLFHYVNNRMSEHNGIDCVSVELLQSDESQLFDDFMIVSRWNRFIHKIDAMKDVLFDITKSGIVPACILHYEFCSFKMVDPDSQSVSLTDLYSSQPV